MNDRHSIRHFPYFVASLSLQERANQKFLINLSVLLLCTSRRKVVKDFKYFAILGCHSAQTAIATV